MSDKLECERVDELLTMAPGHAFQDRDAWRKLAFAFEIKCREKDIEIEKLKTAMDKLGNEFTELFLRNGRT